MVSSFSCKSFTTLVFDLDHFRDSAVCWGVSIQEGSWIRVNFNSLHSGLFLIIKLFGFVSPMEVCDMPGQTMGMHSLSDLGFIWGTIISWITRHRNWMQMLLVMLHGFAWTKKNCVHLLGCFSLHDWTASRRLASHRIPLATFFFWASSPKTNI